MGYPADLKYTNDHEWIRLSGSDAEVGITDFAQRQLGDVVYVELPDVGKAVTKGQVFGTIESVKAVSELFSPASGEVTAVNTDLSSSPEQVNSQPYEAWIIRIKVSNEAEAADLLTSEQYAALVKE
jgi:glycine cleavage system H protein